MRLSVEKAKIGDGWVIKSSDLLGYDQYCENEITAKVMAVFAVQCMETHNEECLSLLRDIMDYRSGNGKYNFSECEEWLRDNLAFDSWMKLETRIKQLIHK
jgi:hypothetical protein